MRRRSRPRWEEPRDDPHEPGFEPGGAGEPKFIGPPWRAGYGPYWGGEPGGRDRARFGDSPDPSRGTRPEGPSGFYWEGLGLAPEGAHRGLGPKNYQRTDARVHDDVCARLTDDHRVDASAIDVRVEDGVVYLCGAVADRAQKRRAERIAERARGVVDVMNELRITRERPRREPHAMPASNGEGRR